MSEIEKLDRSIDEMLRRLRYSRKIKRIQTRKRTKRVLDHYVWGADEIKMSKNDKIFVGASDYGDYVFSQLLDVRSTKGKSTHTREFKLHGNRKDWHNYIEQAFVRDNLLEFNDSNGIILLVNDNFIRYDVSSNSIIVKPYGDMNFIHDIQKDFLEEFDLVTSYIEWIYSNNGESVSVPLNVDRMPVEEMYPFLKGEKLIDYYDRFLKSPANILLLIGPPGTGKTTFIRGLIAHSNSSAIVTYDAAILEKDFVFARFIEDDTGMMVLEDSDNFLKSRSDGNTMMHRFLNVGDGLVTTKGKKMIFSTNLPSIRDVDPALIRPGRCFDILSFEPLTKEQAEKLAQRVEVKLEGDKSTWSIAEVFNKQTDQKAIKKINSKIGFI